LSLREDAMVRRSAQLTAFSLGLVLCARAALADAAAAPAPVPNPAEPAAAAVPPTGPQPRLKFDETTVNLGDIVRGQDAVATFTYHNTGEVPLHILSAKPG
jgi:hypothetical protein